MSAALALTSAATAGQTYGDATLDLFDNGVSNLDIVNVTVSNTATDITFTVETLSFANWTKYLFFINTGAASQSTGNGWNRPIDYNGQTIDHFIGSWVDAPNDNAQSWSYDGSWNLDFTFSNDQSQTGSNLVSWTISLAALGVGIGDSILFDVGTSGGGDLDTAIDLLSRDDPATDWWTNPALSGPFLKYDVVPAPGAAALLVAAGLLRRRRRA